ncbi:MAG: leucine-rich repeat protein, partial [Adlercreutzia sp.]|nr:leucine-rich repeat protein [Adlercreutzia sp.]
MATLLLAMAIPSAALASTTASEETEDIYALYYKNAAGNYTLVIQLGDQDNSAGKYGTYEPASTTLICGGEGNEEEGIEDLCHCFDWNSGSAPHASEITAVHVSKSPGLGYYVAPHALSGWFQGFTKCTTFDLSGLETGNARFMANAFQDCQSLRSFDFNTIDTSKAFNLTSMFEGCTSLESVNFAVDGSISFAYGMFKGCTSLKSIDTTSVNPVAIDRMDEMFMNCTSLKSANLSGIDTEYGSSATSVFSGCTALEEVNLSNFSTIDESGEYGLFSEYGNGIDNFFKGCSALKKIILGDRCDMSSVIPMPSSTFIPNATGKWVNEKGQAFSSRSIPGYTAGTYTAQVTTSTPSQNTKPTTPGGAAGNST